VRVTRPDRVAIRIARVVAEHDHLPPDLQTPGKDDRTAGDGVDCRPPVAVPQRHIQIQIGARMVGRRAGAIAVAAGEAHRVHPVARPQAVAAPFLGRPDRRIIAVGQRRVRRVADQLPAQRGEGDLAPGLAGQVGQVDRPRVRPGSVQVENSQRHETVVVAILIQLDNHRAVVPGDPANVVAGAARRGVRAGHPHRDLVAPGPADAGHPLRP